jgi:hypothetical protein
VTERRRRGFPLEQIVVLSLRGTDSMCFAGVDAIGPFRIRRFTGGYDSLGNQLVTPGELLVDTIGRFKGQQAPAVIVIDIDDAALPPERFAPLVFAAATRATVRLDLCVRAGTRCIERVLSVAD